MPFFAQRPRRLPPEAQDPRAEAAAAAALAAMRGRPAIKAAPRGAAALNKILKPILPEGAGATLAQLKRAWPEIVGERLAQLTEPEKLTRSGKEAGVLTIKCAGSAAPFVQHQQSLLLERANLAGAKVAKLAIVQGAPARPKMSNLAPISAPLSADEESALAAALAKVGDPRLKAALARLKRAVPGRRKA
jgi:hypothetical protein